MAGRNRLELLMFHLNGEQSYGINVFKVREVLPCPKLSSIPQSHRVVRGIANIRGRTISVLDLGLAVGGPPLEDIDSAFLIISEYNRSVQGFLVRSVDRIVNLNWNDILAPPSGTSAGASYLTVVTHVDDKMVEVIDVERVLCEVIGAREHISDEIRLKVAEPAGEKNLVLVFDDSIVARKQVCKTLNEDMGLETVIARNGKQALDLLKQWADDGDPQLDRLAMVISDIEMPVMDGYTFTTEVRSDPRLESLYIVLHTSMSGVFNQSMVDRVGANRFIAKFDPGILAEAVMSVMKDSDHS